MGEFFRKLWTNESVFIRVLRAAAAMTGAIGPAYGWFPPEVGAILAGGSVAIPANRSTASNPGD